MDLSLLPEVSFTVGKVRASLWRKSITSVGEDCMYWVSLGRARPQRLPRREELEVLEAKDIPSAILALKKAHEYLNNHPTAPPQESFVSADLLLNRIP